MDVRLDAVGDRKIQIIKIVRSVAKIGLRDAKALVDAVSPYDPNRYNPYRSAGYPLVTTSPPVSTPTIVARNLTQSDAESMVRDIEYHGGTATVIGEPFVIYVSFSKNIAGEIITDGVDTANFPVWDNSRMVRIALDAAAIEKLFAADIPTLAGTVTADEDGTRGGWPFESPTAY